MNHSVSSELRAMSAKMAQLAEKLADGRAERGRGVGADSPPDGPPVAPEVDQPRLTDDPAHEAAESAGAPVSEALPEEGEERESQERVDVPPPLPPVAGEPPVSGGLPSEAAPDPEADIDDQDEKRTALLFEIREIERELEAKQKKLEELGMLVQDREKAVEAAEAELSELEAAQKSRRGEIERLEVREARVEERESSLETKRTELDEKEQKLIRRESDLVADEAWRRSLLPSWLDQDPVAAWGSQLLDDAHGQAKESNSARLLLATLSIYHHSSREPDPRAVADALRDLGQRLFGWLRDKEIEPYESAQVAQMFADKINEDCSGRCQVEVPLPESPASNQTMLFQPRSGGTLHAVASVQSWCVRGARREVIHRASVTV